MMRRLGPFAGAVVPVLCAGLMSIAQPVATAADPGACRVRNEQSGERGSDLQALLNSADPGQTILIRGICLGNFTAWKSVSLTGVATDAVPRATLWSNGISTVLVVVHGTTVTLTDIVVRDGNASYGGGVYNEGTLTLAGATSVRGNVAVDSGGGIHNYFGTLILEDHASVRGNTASGYGGGVWNQGGTVRMKDRSVVRGNTADLGGGIAMRETGTLVLRGASSVLRNEATSYGGGIDALGRVVLARTSSVRGNTSYNGGGIVNNGTLIVKGRSQVRGNTADGYGGGISNFGNLVLDASSSVTANTAGSGGGVLFNGPSLVLKRNAQVVGNTATGSGGGIYVDGSRTVEACNRLGIRSWFGAISPNEPDDPPQVKRVTCS